MILNLVGSNFQVDAFQFNMLQSCLLLRAGVLVILVLNIAVDALSHVVTVCDCVALLTQIDFELVLVLRLGLRLLWCWHGRKLLRRRWWVLLRSWPIGVVEHHR